MCDTCYNRGYNDFPVRLGSAEHPRDYERGYLDRQKETGEDSHILDATGYCDTCYNRGIEDAGTGIYAGPTTNVRGHKESYSKGYNEDNRRKEEQQREANEREERKRKEQEDDRRRKKMSQQPSENDEDLNPGRPKTWQEELFGVGLIIALVIGAIWLAVNVVLPLLIINIATLALIGSFIIKGKRLTLNILSFLGAIYIFLDFNNGWLTKTLPEHISSFGVVIPFLFYFNFFAGLIAGYFVLRDLLNKNSPSDKTLTAFSKRNIIIIVCLLFTGGTAIFLQNYLRGRIPNSDRNESHSVNAVDVTKPQELNTSASSVSVLTDGVKKIAIQDVAYFYNSPDISTKRKAYLLKGDKIVAKEVSGSFFYGEFTNGTGVVSKGWLLLDDFNNYNESPGSRINNSNADYEVTSCNSIIDKKTNIEWYVSNDADYDWQKANDWVANLDICNGHWELPTVLQVMTLYNAAKSAGTGYYNNGVYYPAKIDSVFNQIGRGSWVWTKEEVDDKLAFTVNLNQGIRVRSPKKNISYPIRVLAVRKK